MGAILQKIFIAVVCTAIARGIVLALHLDEHVALLIGSAQDSAYLPSIAWALSGVLGVSALVLWETFDLSGRLRDLSAPKPKIGSLPFQDYVTQLEVHAGGEAVNFEMAVKLLNQNDQLIEFRCRLAGLANERPFEPIDFRGYVAANQTTLLVMRMPALPTLPNNGRGQAVGVFDYDVSFFFPGHEHSSRRTKKVIAFDNFFQVQPGPDVQQVRNVVFREEVEQ